VFQGTASQSCCFADVNGIGRGKTLSKMQGSQYIQCRYRSRLLAMHVFRVLHAAGQQPIGFVGACRCSANGIEDYFKYGATPANLTEHWYNFLFGIATDGDSAIGTGMEIVGDTLLPGFLNLPRPPACSSRCPSGYWHHFSQPAFGCPGTLSNSPSTPC
jgi:hypothetical protein